LRELEALLVSHGLYPREARAMVETWRDSWFEEGTRLLYLVHPKAIAAVVPLEISPVPAHIERVFVGRMEIVTPATKEEVEAAITSFEFYGSISYSDELLTRSRSPPASIASGGGS